MNYIKKLLFIPIIFVFFWMQPIAQANIFKDLFGGSIPCKKADNIMRKGIQDFYHNIQLGLKKIKKAQKACRNNEEYLFNIGTAYYKTGDLKSAISAYKDALRIQSNFTEAKIALAWTQTIGNIDVDSAMKTAKKLISNNLDYRLLYILVFGSKIQGDMAGWEKWINKAKLTIALENKENIKQYTHSIAITKESITMKNRVPKLYAELGFLYEKMLDYDQAMRYFTKSNSPHGWWNLGRMYARQRKTDKAKELLQQALEFSSLLKSEEIYLIKQDLKHINTVTHFYRHMINFIYPEKFTLIPMGEFTMGSKNGPTIEKPEHIVYIDAFLMGNFEVTNTEYKIYVDSTGYIPPYNCCKEKYDMWNVNNIPREVVNFPVVNVSWFDAIRYIKWKNKKFKKKYRLPSEAEWEKSARGTNKRPFPWGKIDPTLEFAYFSRHWDGNNTFVPVDSYEKGKSPYGLHHMAGSVWEWCNDWFKKGYFVKGKRKNPIGPTLGDFKVLRGGSWMNLQQFIKTTYRNRNWPDVRYNGIGFRLADDL